jgi:hypothetical protein
MRTGRIKMRCCNANSDHHQTTITPGVSLVAVDAVGGDLDFADAPEGE